MSRILVTGGCGFIGANLVPKLVAGGAEVRVLDNLSRGSREYVRDAEVLEGDIRDGDAVARALDGVTRVVHLAAFGSVAESVEEPFENFDVNVRGTLVLLRASAEASVEKFVFASTGGAIMGDTPPPVDETSLPWPISPYGASKLCGEAYLHAFAGSFGLPTVALRFANVYGPVSEHKKGAVTNFIKRALRREPLVIYGDGNATRDFLYVDDLCDGIASALEAPLHDEVIHLASGTETSINELARLVLDLTDAQDVPIRHEGRRRGEIERTFATADRARERLGFAPAHSLEDGMRKTVEWFAEREQAGAPAAAPD
ncbi:MAG: NAD-dependent epimerase/dehydratase family protein [Actinobacteria bacterium]|nr:NAD-dependent epimerase/dehydratase family protein [Actinomycetota bacterium]